MIGSAYWIMTLEIFITIFSIALLLGFSSFFSCSETALTAASRVRMHRLAETGERRAVTVVDLLRRPERLLGVILLGNNITNIVASVLATGLSLHFVGETGVIYAAFVMTILIVICAELLPKISAIGNPDRTALRVATPLWYIALVLSPAAILAQFLARHASRFIGIKPMPDKLLSAHEELRSAIDLHHREGNVVKNDRDMLGGILDLPDVDISEIIVHRKNMTLVNADLESTTIIEQVLAGPHTRIPLWRGEKENIVGILHVRTLLQALVTAHGDASAININSLLSPPWFVPETTSLRVQLNAFLQRKTPFALVVDEYGALMGLVTLEDILEEIVGEISDEHDVETHGMRLQKEKGAVNVDGDVTIRDLNRAMDWDLPDGEATTIAGLVMHEAQTIPEVGQVFSLLGFRFEILRRHYNQITALRITPQSPDSERAQSLPR